MLNKKKLRGENKKWLQDEEELQLLVQLLEEEEELQEQQVQLLEEEELQEDKYSFRSPLTQLLRGLFLNSFKNYQLICSRFS